MALPIPRYELVQCYVYSEEKLDNTYAGPRNENNFASQSHFAENAKQKVGWCIRG